jgi:hypothetical protein
MSELILNIFGIFFNWASTPAVGKISPGAPVYLCGAISITNDLEHRAGETAENTRITISGDCSSQGGANAVVDGRIVIPLTGRTQDGAANRWYATIASNPTRLWYKTTGGPETALY